MSEIEVEIVYALPERQYLYKVQLKTGSNVGEAIHNSGLLELRTDINLQNNKLGIYSHPVKLDHLLKNGDRIEIYRPLIADPKKIRNLRGKIKK